MEIAVNERPRGDRLILGLLDGFIQSRTLMTAFELDIFTPLVERPRSRAELFAERNLPERSGVILINACLALGLLEERDSILSVPVEVAPLLVRGPHEPFRLPTYLIDYYGRLYADLANMTEIIRSDGSTSTFKGRDYFKEDVNDIDPQHAADYSSYMDATMEQIVGVVLETYPFSRHASLLDLCGGVGTFTRHVVRAHPGLSGTFMDVPACAAIGAETLARDADLAQRIRAVGGDVFRDPLPGGADVVTMCRSAHDWSDEQAQSLFQKVHEALPAHGRLLLIERMIPDTFDQSARSLYLRAIYFLAKSTTACYRSVSQYRRLLTDAGFSSVEVLEPPRDPNPFFQGMKILVAERA
jgi:demethylspheroidene O-methyltransferase